MVVMKKVPIKVFRIKIRCLESFSPVKFSAFLMLKVPNLKKFVNGCPKPKWMRTKTLQRPYSTKLRASGSLSAHNQNCNNP